MSTNTISTSHSNEQIPFKKHKKQGPTILGTIATTALGAGTGYIIGGYKIIKSTTKDIFEPIAEITKEKPKTLSEFSKKITEKLPKEVTKKLLTKYRKILYGWTAGGAAASLSLYLITKSLFAKKSKHTQ